MNQQIRQLAEQAESYANSKIHMTGWNYREEYNKKFAELIAMETWKVIVKSQRGHMNPTSALDAVKQHFGVEE